MVVALLIVVVEVIITVISVVAIAVVVAAAVVIVAEVVTVVVVAAAVVVEKISVSINHGWCNFETWGSTKKYARGLATTTGITTILTFHSFSSSVFND